VREIQPGHIHAAANQLANHSRRTTSGPKGADDLRLASDLEMLRDYCRCGHARWIRSML